MYMTDQAGPQICMCQPGTNFWHLPIDVTQFWHPRSSFGTRFSKAKKYYICQEARRGKSMKQKLSEMVQVTVLFHTNQYIFVWSFQNGNGRQNHSQGAKTGLLRRAGAKTQFPSDTRNVGGRLGLSYVSHISNISGFNSQTSHIYVTLIGFGL